jgi:hypothetical protein
MSAIMSMGFSNAIRAPCGRVVAARCAMVHAVHGVLSMRYTARVSREASGYCAECLEIEALGDGVTREAALASLRAELEERLTHVEGVAPPSKPAPSSLQLVVLDDPQAEPAPGGPGDPA